jgi:flagellar hook-length control protein FliK
MPQPVARQIAPPANTASMTHGSAAIRLLRTENRATGSRTALAPSPKTRFHESLKQVEARSREKRSEPTKSEGPSHSRVDRGKTGGKTARATKGKRRADAADRASLEADDVVEEESSLASAKAGVTATPTDDVEASSEEVAGGPAEADEPTDSESNDQAHFRCDLAATQSPQGAADTAAILPAAERPPQDAEETAVIDPDAAASDDDDASKADVEASADTPTTAAAGDTAVDAVATAAQAVQAAQASAAEPIAGRPGASEPTAASIGSRATAKPAFGASALAADPESPETASAASAQAAATGPSSGAPADGAFQQFLDQFDPAKALSPSPHKSEQSEAVTDTRSADLFNSNATTTREAAAPKLAAAPPAPELPPEAHFAAENHEKIVTGVRGELLPNGGTMRLRLDPPELGTLQVSLHMRDGVVTVAFETANNDAARMLSHTLGDLRATLESHGITVDKLHVQQSPRDESGDSSGRNDSERPDQTFEQQQESRREQRRRDAVQRIWDKLAGLAPIDLVA